jgi:meso-butanediol dehydrogenase / (S,S)-butanediol dehydrogenase / diacetyl reductase
LTALVTGAGTGIGEATARALAAAGHRVAVTDIDLAAATRVADDLPGARAFAIDVRDGASITAACADAVEALGPLAVWVSSAGVSSMARFVDLTEAEIDWNLDVNARGAILCGQTAARQFIAQRTGGIVVNVASMAGKRGGVAYLAHYIASKFAVVGLTQAMAAELAEHDIRVNAVCPGYVDTGMQDREIVWEAQLRGLTTDEVAELHLSDTPLRRTQTPTEVAALIAFLSSDAAASITGESVAINGGSYMD